MKILEKNWKFLGNEIIFFNGERFSKDFFTRKI